MEKFSGDKEFGDLFRTLMKRLEESREDRKRAMEIAMMTEVVYREDDDGKGR